VVEKTFDLRGRKLFVAIPSYDHKLSVKAAVSLAELAALSIQEGIALGIHPVCGTSMITFARNLLVDAFLKSGATDLLFLDSDINFKASDAIRLLALATDYPIVSGVPRMRKPDGDYLIVLHKNADGSPTINKLGLIKASRVSTSFLMIRREVFEKMQTAHPEWWHPSHKVKNGLTAYFDFAVTPEGYMGEDFLFCDRAKDLGYEIWADPSIKLGHMGTMEFEGDFRQNLIDVTSKPTLLNSAA